MLPFDITLLSNFELTDSGNPDTGRYVIEAIAQHSDDTSKAAYIHICSNHNRAVAELILQALLEFKASFASVERLLAR